VEPHSSFNKVNKPVTNKTDVNFTDLFEQKAFKRTSYNTADDDMSNLFLQCCYYFKES